MSKSTTPKRPAFNNTAGDNMSKSTTPKRPAFNNTVRDANAANGGFDVSTAADIGLKTLVAATCGVVLYKSFATSGDSK